MRIIQAAAVSYYFEDGLSCWSRKPVAMPIIAEVRDEAREAGQAKASGAGRGARGATLDIIDISISSQPWIQWIALVSTGQT